MKYLLIFLLIIGCGTRKTTQQHNKFKSDTLVTENKRVLKQEIKFNDIYSIVPFDTLKPMLIDGKEYFNASIVFDKSIIKKYEKQDNEIKKQGSTVKTEKAKQTEKKDNTILFISMFFILCLFIFIWFKLAK
jgi:hypothetical protein